MSDYPPPGGPAGYNGDYSRPYDPQYVDPQYGRQPYPVAPQLPYPQPPTRPPGNRGPVVALVIGGVLGIVAVVVALSVLTSADDDSGTRALPVPTSPSAPVPAPGTSGPGAFGPATPGGSGLPPTAAATIVGIQYFDGLQSQDPAQLQDVACPGVSVGANTDLAHIVSALPTGAAVVNGATATMDGTVQLDDGTEYGLEVTLRQQSPLWCVLRDEKR